MTNIEIADIPSELFWRGQLIRDVPKIRLLSMQEKKENGRGQPDIEVKSMIHGTYKVYRSVVRDTFQDTQCKPIKVNRLHTNKAYQTQVPMVPPVQIAFLTPSRNIQYLLNGKPLNCTKYILFSVSTDGNVLVQNAKVVSKKFFEKTVNVTDTVKSITKRLERKKATEDKPASDYLLGDCRVIAKVISKSTWDVKGYVIGFIDEQGNNSEKPLPMDTIQTLVQERRVRNVSNNFRMTYGNLNELPAYYVD